MGTPFDSKSKSRSFYHKVGLFNNLPIDSLRDVRNFACPQIHLLIQQNFEGFHLHLRY